jgi:hypothetical protein
MSSGGVRVLVIGVALGSLVATTAAAQAGKPAAASPQPTRAASGEVTGEYRGYSGKWINLWTADHRQLRYEVDEHSVPGWQKRFKPGEQITITYKDLGTRRIPMATGIRTADATPKKK